MKKVKFAKIFKTFRLTKSLTQFKLPKCLKFLGQYFQKLRKEFLNFNVNRSLCLLSSLGKDNHNLLAEVREIGVTPLIKVE